MLARSLFHRASNRVPIWCLALSAVWLAAAGVSPASAQRTLKALTEMSACVGDTIRLEGSTYYVTFDWKPDLFGRRDGRNFSFVVGAPVDVILRSEPPLGPNLMGNYNFSNGLAEFTTDYKVITPSTGQAGELAVLADLRDFEPTWRDCPDVTRDGGPDKMLVARGNGDAKSAICRSKVTFERDSFYVITFLATTTGVGPEPKGGQLGIRIDDSPLSTLLRMPDFNCSWRQYYAIYKAPRSGEFDIAVVDQASRAGFGYAVDGVLTAKVEPTRIDTFRFKVIPADSAFASTDELCPGEVFEAQHYTARGDSTVCTRIVRPGQCDSVFCESVRYRPKTAVTAGVRSPSCAGGRDGSIALTVDAAPDSYDVSWSDTAERGLPRTGLPSGTYVATVTLSTGCVQRHEYQLIDPPVLRWSAAGFAPEDCPEAGPQSLFLETAGGTGRVGFGFRQIAVQVARIELLPEVEVSVTATDSQACRIDTLLDVPTLSTYEAIAIGVVSEPGGPTNVIYTGGPPTGGLATWRLNRNVVGVGPQLTLPAGTAGLLQFELKMPSGCVWAGERTLIAADRIEYFPNAFSPNGDDVNDVFWIVNRPNVVTVELFEVYNRWGGLVFRREGCSLAASATTPNDCAWSGLREGRGTELDSDVYVYVAKLKLTDGSTIETEGEIHLLR